MKDKRPNWLVLEVGMALIVSFGLFLHGKLKLVSNIHVSGMVLYIHSCVIASQWAE